MDQSDRSADESSPQLEMRANAAVGVEVCPDCGRSGSCVEVLDDDLLLRCAECGSRWRHALGYLLPLGS
jgi:hypothetical protein